MSFHIIEQENKDSEEITEEDRMKSSKTSDVKESIAKITSWNLDREPSERDAIQRAINWTVLCE